MKGFGLACLLLLTGCAGGNSLTSSTAPEASSSTSADKATTDVEDTATADFPPAPAVPDGPVSEEVAEAIDRLLAHVFTETWDLNAIGDLADLGDARTAWLLADLMRFYQQGPVRDELSFAFFGLTNAPFDPGKVDFVWATDNLIAWDLPAWEGYADAKAAIFTQLEDAWAQFFAEDQGVDWRFVTWGGVLADDRPLGDNGPCNCIPALDYPETTDASGGDWYPDDAIVFGVVVNGEALAMPKNQMEVHEMLNLTLGGRELGIPYCTLCGSGQAYLVDDVPDVDRVVLRTSGLLSRSNKLMYDITTGSAIDTFTGRALTGPLGAAGVTLEQVSVVASTWGDWKTAHPDTRIIARDGGIGRSYVEDPLRGRDENGPIFPVGDVDPRLPIQEKVVGVISPAGTPIAFPATITREALGTGDIAYQGLNVRLEDAIRVYDGNGVEVISHEAFWFAWSQFHPDTLVWSPVGS